MAPMKYFITLITLITAFGIGAQVSDDFSDLDFTNNPTWAGTTGDFTVNGTGQVQTNTAIATTSYLSTPHGLATLDNKEWRYWAKITTAPSSTNFGRIYLTAASSNITTNPDGFYLQLGEALSTDAVRLMKQVSGVSTQICASADGSIAASFTNSIRVLRDNTGIWTLFIDAAGGTNYTQVGSGTDATNLIGTHTGYQATYTASNSTKFYFDNVYVGNIIVDATPPTVTSVTAINADLVDVLFSEPVDLATAQNVGNYDLQPFNSLISATRDGINLALVHCVPMNSLQNGNQYNMITSNIEDLVGNPSVSQSTLFEYLIAETPVSGDVIINEFMCDPTPVVGLPEVEFVEIHNRSNKIFNLTNWKLGDASGDGTVLNGWLLPGEYKILCATSSLTNYPNGIGVTSFPSLNNSGDDIILRSDAGLQIDKLTYSSAWYQDEAKNDGGYTLERINTNSICSSSNNWIASNDPSGGTPGLLNSVNNTTPDTQAPVISQTLVTDPTIVQLFFSEAMDSTSLAQTAITVNPTLTELSRTIIGAYPTSMELAFQETFLLSQTYTITLSSMADCSMNTTVGTGQFTLPDVPAPGDVIINEFICDQSPVVGLPEVEFVEIYNRSNKVFYMQGWKLGDSSSFGTINNAYLMPGEYKILAASSSLIDYPSAVGVSSFPSLNNSGDKIRLQDDLGVMLDEIEYTSAWYHDDTRNSGGYSIERKNPTIPCSGIDNWSASLDQNGGTPGTINSIYDLTPDTQSPSIVETFAITNNTIRIYFSEGMDSTSLANSILSVSPSITELNRVVGSGYPNTMDIGFTAFLQPSLTYNYTLSPLSDCSSNTATGIGSFALADEAQIGDVVINEILFNPITGGSDWVELYNKSDKLLNLKDWEFANFANDTIANNKKITKNYLLKPKDYVVVGKDSTFVINNYPAAVPGKFCYISALPSLNTDSSTLFVIYPAILSSPIMDKLSYSDKWHFKLLDSDKGKSLERINPDAITQDLNNWHTAAEAIGFATPGKENSQFYPAISSGTVSFTADVFSPDSDGFEDILQINYELETAGLVGTMTIYDDRGRKIRELAKSELLGLTGTIVWDGVNDEGTKASIGTYVLIFEAFQVDGGMEFVSKKAFVLAGKVN